MFNKLSIRLEETLKEGHIVPVHDDGNKNDKNIYKGVGF